MGFTEEKVGSPNYHQCFYWYQNKRCSRYVPENRNYCNEHIPAKYSILPSKDKSTIGIESYLKLAEAAIVGYDINEILKTELTGQEFEADTTNDIIDGFYENNLEWFKNYKGKHMLSDVHFRLHVSGSRNDIDLFYAILHEVDGDFPLDPFRPNGAELDCCKSCKGWVWNKATITPEKIKRAAKQVGIKCKIKLWLEGTKCKGGVEKRVVPV